MKSNIGHAQAAAGVAGVIKMVLALQHGMLPPTLHADEPSPHVDWSAGAVRLLTEPVPWPATRAGRAGPGCPRSGSAAPTPTSSSRKPPAASRRPHGAASRPAVRRRLPVLAGAARWRGWCRAGPRTALAAQAGRLAAYVAARPDLDPADVGWSLATTRSVFEHRAVVTGADRDELLAGLAAVAAGQPAAGVVTGRGRAGRGQGGVRVPRPGRPVGRDGPGAGRGARRCSRPGWPSAARRWPRTWTGRWTRCSPARGRAGPGPGRRGAAGAVGGDGVAGRGLAGGRGHPGRGGRATPRARSPRRAWPGSCPGGRGAGGGAAQPGAGARWPGGAGWCRWPSPPPRCGSGWPRGADRLSVAAVNGPAATVVSGEPGRAGRAGRGVRRRRACGPGCCRWTTPRTARRWRRSGRRSWPRWPGSRPGPARIPMVSAMTGECLAGPGGGRRRTGTTACARRWSSTGRSRVLAGPGTGCSSRCPRTRC